MIEELAGGKVVEGAIDAYPRIIQPSPIRLRHRRIHQVLGIEVPTKQVKAYLEALGLNIRKEDEDDLVVIPIAGPRVLPGALFRHCQQAGPVNLRLAAPLSDPGWLQADWQDAFRIEFELFIGDFARPATDEGRATYLPNLFSLQMKEHDEDRPERRRIDVLITAVTPPDDEGYVSSARTTGTSAPTPAAPAL